MKLRLSPIRWAAWSFALALLLKAAMPLLATGSAQLRGKAVVEVCTVYGVATVALQATDSPAGHDAPTSHAGEHCVLNAGVDYAGSDLQLPRPPQPGGKTLQRVSARAQVTADARAAWMARLEHAPPAFA
jgi:hypothetical protein